MKAWMNQKLADATRKWLHEVRADLGPQLCCEKDGLTAEDGVSLVTDLIATWGRELVLCLLYRGSQWRACIVSPDVLRGIIEKAVDTEEVVSIIDMTVLGGCTVDFTPDDDGETFELLLTAWGEHEESARDLAERLEGVETFRGN